MALLHKIQNALAHELPGDASHRKMLPPNRVLKARANINGIKNSSVLVLLFCDADELMVCLIKRPPFMKHHAGQIALPGGRMEEGETDIETALRETFEEIGVVPESIQIVGKLSRIYVEISNFRVQPIVGWMDGKPTFHPNDQEVEKTICFPVKRFSPPYTQEQIETMTGPLTVPCINYEGETIWGATAMILAEFYDMIKSCLD